MHHAEPRQHHQDKGTGPSIGSSGFHVGLGSTAAGISDHSLDSPALVASETPPKLSKPAPRAETSRDLSSRIAEARSSHAALFDRAWLDGIKQPRCLTGDAGTLSVRDERRARDQRRGKANLTRSTDESDNVPTGRPAAEFEEGGQGMEAMLAAGASAGGLGAGDRVDPSCGGIQQRKGRGQASFVLAYPAWNEAQQPSSLTVGCKATVESVVQRTMGSGGGRGLSRTFKRPWHPSQWEAFQVWKYFLRKEITNWRYTLNSADRSSQAHRDCVISSSHVTAVKTDRLGRCPWLLRAGCSRAGGLWKQLFGSKNPSRLWSFPTTILMLKLGLSARRQTYPFDVSMRRRILNAARQRAHRGISAACGEPPA